MQLVTLDLEIFAAPKIVQSSGVASDTWVVINCFLLQCTVRTPLSKQKIDFFVLGLLEVIRDLIFILLYMLISINSWLNCNFMLYFNPQSRKIK